MDEEKMNAISELIASGILAKKGQRVFNPEKFRKKYADKFGENDINILDQLAFHFEQSVVKIDGIEDEKEKAKYKPIVTYPAGIIEVFDNFMRTYLKKMYNIFLRFSKDGEIILMDAEYRQNEIYRKNRMQVNNLAEKNDWEIDVDEMPIETIRLILKADRLFVKYPVDVDRTQIKYYLEESFIRSVMSEFKDNGNDGEEE